jgi:hypothetical protein
LSPEKTNLKNHIKVFEGDQYLEGDQYHGKHSKKFISMEEKSRANSCIIFEKKHRANTAQLSMIAS